MRLHRFGGLLVVATLAACIGDSPTGLEETQVVDGVRIHNVPDVGEYMLQQAMVVDERLQCEVIDFAEFAGGTTAALLTTTKLGVDIDFYIDGWTDDLPNDCGTGDVLIFDTSVPSGPDPDLVLAGQSVVPNLGNVATHQSCQTPGTPNDADVEDTLRFDFPAGTYYVASFAALDQEGDEGEQIALNIDILTDNIEVGATDMTQDNADMVEVVEINPPAEFNNNLAFMFDGSGAIDNIEICQAVERGGEGCTPGYWRQPHHFDSWTVPTNTLFGDVFDGFCAGDDASLAAPESGSLCGLTLLEALVLRGGGVNALARHAAAAWLNADSSVDYYYSTDEVESMVEAALMAEDYEGVKNGLEEANEAGCPLN